MSLLSVLIQKKRNNKNKSGNNNSIDTLLFEDLQGLFTNRYEEDIEGIVKDYFKLVTEYDIEFKNKNLFDNFEDKKYDAVEQLHQIVYNVREAVKQDNFREFRQKLAKVFDFLCYGNEDLVQYQELLKHYSDLQDKLSNIESSIDGTKNCLADEGIKVSDQINLTEIEEQIRQKIEENKQLRYPLSEFYSSLREDLLRKEAGEKGLKELYGLFLYAINNFFNRFDLKVNTINFIGDYFKQNRFTKTMDIMEALCIPQNNKYSQNKIIDLNKTNNKIVYTELIKGESKDKDPKEVIEFASSLLKGEIDEKKFLDKIKKVSDSYKKHNL